MKTALTQEQAQKQAQAQELSFHSKNSLGARTRAEISIRAIISLWKQPWRKNKKWSKQKRKNQNFSFFLRLLLCLIQHFPCEKGTRSKHKECFLAVFYQPIKVLVPSSLAASKAQQRFQGQNQKLSSVGIAFIYNGDDQLICFWYKWRIDCNLC